MVVVAPIGGAGCLAVVFRAARVTSVSVLVVILLAVLAVV